MSNRAWVTLATNDSYGLGALVLAHSLRRVGSTHSTVVLITPSVTDAMRDRLRAVFTEVVTVDVLDSRDAAHLALLQRPELGITFTKIHCWGLTQYEKCVFLDADTLVVQNCDELFEREELSAAPDVGWPDCFNSGVFVYKPSTETFNELIKFAQERGSFDGGDQGLLNSFFSDWARGDINKHLPFLYNVTSAAFYSYLPALKYYGQDLKIIHFIGAAKPWLQQFNWDSRSVDAPDHIRGLLQLWWDIFVGQVHHQLDVTMSGVAGNLARVVPGSGLQREALDELTRRQGWEAGNIDYMGADSFDNIWAKISQTLNQPRVSPPKQSPPKEPTPPPKQPSPAKEAAPEQPSPPKEAPQPVAPAVEAKEAPAPVEAVAAAPGKETPVSPAVEAAAPAPVAAEAPVTVEAAAQVSAPAPVESVAPVQAALAPVVAAAPVEIPAPVPASVPAPVETPAPAPVEAPTAAVVAPAQAEAAAPAPAPEPAKESPKTDKTEVPPTPPATPKSTEASTPVEVEPPAVAPPASPAAAAEAPASPEKALEASAASTDSPPLANTPSKEEAPVLPAAKSEESERRGPRPATKLQLPEPVGTLGTLGTLATPDSEHEDAAALAQAIIAGELRTPTVSEPTPPVADLPSPAPAPQPKSLSVDEPSIPTPPVGAVSLAQIGVKPKGKATTAAQIESSVSEQQAEPAPTSSDASKDAPKKKIVKKVVKKDASGAEAPVPPPRKKEKKPKEK